MEGGAVYDDSRITNALLKNERVPCTSDVLDSLWVQNSSPSFHASASMVNFENIQGDTKTERPFLPQIDSKAENCNDDGFDVCFHHPEKKRRLSPNQVQFLEKSFDEENKLEPERKLQLAKELGLQPRQVAIWFQNRRARYKTKLLEKEFDSLKSCYDTLKADYDTLYKENEKLKTEVNSLSEKLRLRDNGKPRTEQCDDHPISPLDSHPNKPICSQNAAQTAACKQEDAASSAKSDVFDSDSPHYTDGNHSAVLEPADSSNVFEPDASDFSQDEDDSFNRSCLLPSLSFPKLEVECLDDLQPNSCNLGFPVQDQGTWFWQY